MLFCVTRITSACYPPKNTLPPLGRRDALGLHRAGEELGDREDQAEGARGAGREALGADQDRRRQGLAGVEGSHAAGVGADEGQGLEQASRAHAAAQARELEAFSSGGEQAQLGATASDCLRPRGLTASTGKRTKPACAAADEEEHLHPEAGGERRRRRGPTTLVFPGEQA